MSSAHATGTHPLLLADESPSKIPRIEQVGTTQSESVKKVVRRTSENQPVCSFDTLLKVLGTGDRNVWRVKDGSTVSVVRPVAQLISLQTRVFQLLKL